MTLSSNQTCQSTDSTSHLHSDTPSGFSSFSDSLPRYGHGLCASLANNGAAPTYLPPSIRSHVPNRKEHPEHDRKDHSDVPYYWGRGDGWMAVGMTELLFNLPENDSNRARIMKGYLLMMNNLKKYVNKDGLWNQLIDQPDFWTETSGSAMFAYAMILGVQNGWLDKEEFAPVARRAWLGLCNYIDDKNDLTEVCIGTGKKNSKQYYMDRPRIAGDYHGQAPILWCAYALLNNK